MKISAAALVFPATGTRGRTRCRRRDAVGDGDSDDAPHAVVQNRGENCGDLPQYLVAPADELPGASRVAADCGGTGVTAVAQGVIAL